jgi:hypothetical protein
LALLAACGGGNTLTGLSSSGGTGTGTGGGTTTVSMGSGAAGSFQAGVIAISTKSLSAGGSTSLQVIIVDKTGAAYTTATTVTFSSPCVGQNLATITATGQPAGTATVITSTGTATATYVATGCSGPDVITATANANSQNLSATGTVTVAQAAIGSIKFISATPTNITLKGVGSATGSATSTVIFKVLDTSGGPRAGATVTFALNTTVGGLSMAPTSATTDANGQVQTIVSSGTVAATVSVTASTTTANSTTISTESNALSVSTGIPTSANISLAVLCQNVEAWEIDGVSVPVTVSMTDRSSNPVPDGTAANFRTTLGGIQGTCLTGSTTAGSGSCQVNWVSKAPYSVAGNPRSTSGNASAASAYCPGPAFVGANALCNTTTNGRSPIVVTAIGEESFIDADGSGVFDTKDIVPFNAADLDNYFPASGTPAPWSNGAAKPWFDTSEPFLNQWELFDTYGTPIFIPGEWFLDFNNNGTRDGPDGLVESALCQGPLCDTASSSVAISASNVIILSGGHANFVPLPNTSFHVGTGLSFSVTIADDRNQQMPAKTTVSASMAASTATIVGPSSYTWPCATAVGGQTFTFNLTPALSFVPGPLIITVTTPGGIITTAFYPLVF